MCGDIDNDPWWKAAYVTRRSTRLKEIHFVASVVAKVNDSATTENYNNVGSLWDDSDTFRSTGHYIIMVLFQYNQSKERKRERERMHHKYYVTLLLLQAVFMIGHIAGYDSHVIILKSITQHMQT